MPTPRTIPGCKTFEKIEEITTISKSTLQRKLKGVKKGDKLKAA